MITNTRLFYICLLVIVGLFSCDLISGEDDGEDILDQEEETPTEIVFINPIEILELESTHQFLYRVIPDSIALTDAVWSSADPDIASVSQDGTVTGVSIGQTAIKIRSEKEDAEAVAIINIAPIPLYNLYLPDEIITAYIDVPKTLDLTFDPENATNKSVLWKTSDSEIVAIDQSGTITAKRLGYAWIDVEHQGTQAFDNAHIIPAKQGQLIAANQVSARTNDQKYFIYLYVGALERAASISSVELYAGTYGNPSSHELIKPLNPNLNLTAGSTVFIPIEISESEANTLSYGRYVKLNINVGEKDYEVTLGWTNDISETEL